MSRATGSMTPRLGIAVHTGYAGDLVAGDAAEALQRRSSGPRIASARGVAEPEGNTMEEPDRERSGDRSPARPKDP